MPIKKTRSFCPPCFNARSNLKAEGLKVKEVLCDAGCSSSEALKALKEHRVTGFGFYKPERPGFKYHAEGDDYKCSQKVKLSFKKFSSSHNGTCQMKEYRSRTTVDLCFVSGKAEDYQVQQLEWQGRLHGLLFHHPYKLIQFCSLLQSTLVLHS